MYLKTNKPFMPNSIRDLLSTGHYQMKLIEFAENAPDTLTESDVCDFQNQYIKDLLLKDCPAIIAGNNVITKDNLYDVFHEHTWQRLNLQERYTSLNWLQQHLSNNDHPVPDIVFSSPHLTDKLGVYIPYKNQICIDYDAMKTGIYVASIMIHEMDHFNNYINPEKSGKVPVKNSFVELKNYLSCKKSKQELLNIELDATTTDFRPKLLLYKNLVAHVRGSYFKAEEVNDFDTFTKYMQRELYFYSPLEQSAYAKQVEVLTQIMDNNKNAMSSSDVNLYSAIKKSSNKINSLEIAPVLANTETNKREELLNNTLRRIAHNANNTLHSQSGIDCLMRENLLLNDLYDRFKTKTGELVRI